MYLPNATTVTGKLTSQVKSIDSTGELVSKILGCTTIVLLMIGIMTPMFISLKGGSAEGMVITALGAQMIYFTSLVEYKIASNLTGFMQFLRFTRIELDSMPNIFTEYIINEGSRTEYLLRSNDMNFYEIANMIEFNNLKLLLLLIFSFGCVVLSSLLI